MTIGACSHILHVPFHNLDQSKDVRFWTISVSKLPDKFVTVVANQVVTSEQKALRKTALVRRIGYAVQEYLKRTHEETDHQTEQFKRMQLVLADAINQFF